MLQRMPVKLTPMNWFVILLAIAVILALVLPPDPVAVRSLHTTAFAYRLAVATLLIPYAVIWYAAFYAFAKLQEYTRTLNGSKDGRAFRQITIGMGAIAFSLVVPTILSLVLNNMAAHNAGFRTAAHITEGYLDLYPGLIAFLLLKNGTRRLVRTTRGWGRGVDLRWHAPWFLLLGVVFTYIAVEHRAAYHLGTMLLIVTIIVPYLYGWVLGLLAALDLKLYAEQVRGALYKRAVRWLSSGIAVTITGSIAIQFVNVTLMHSGKRTLGLVLLLDYMLLIIIVAGLGMIALGTKRLKRFEEV